MQRSISTIQNWPGMDPGARRATLADGRHVTRVPGELGIWAFLCADLIVFTLYFVTFLWERGHARDVFAAGSHTLHLTIGVINTLVLLTSSLFVALATQAVRNGKGLAGRKFIAGAFAGGLVFIVNKPIEWIDKVQHGLTPHTDNFFQLYYMMTGLHLLHVIVGMVVLTFLWRLAGRVQSMPTERQVRFLESGATYWHLVDLIWLVLFALFYLLK
jgi:nitric oxide reductase NorE protein